MAIPNNLVGVWWSSLDEETNKQLRRDLGLLITKQPVWAHVESEQVSEPNEYGAIVSRTRHRYVSEPIKDARIHKIYDSNGTITIDVMMQSGKVRDLPVNAAYFSTMQSEYKFMKATEASEE
ncbi:MAG: hypothetical protein LKF00_04155 [Olsenella sp.]|nr:hypothetical protein [Olsenella sp.]